MLPAKNIKPGEYIQTTSEVIKVLVSQPETQSSAAGTSTQWYICGYSETQPTRNIICDPNLEFEIVSGV
jgi:hypothetical protein